MFDINAPIFPNLSIGEIKLRESKNSLIEGLKTNNILYEVSYEKANDTRVSLFSIFDDIIVIAIDNINSKIFRITAKFGYVGKLLNKIKIGDTLKDVYNTGEDFYYDEREDTVLSNKYPGVSMDLEVSDYLITNISNPSIENISVFAEESMTLQGQRGKW